jgi:hypothetical protein
MASALYPSFKELLLKGDIDLENDTIKAALIDSADYTYSSAHDFYNDVSAGTVGTPGTLASKTVASGVFDAADLTISSVTGDPCEAVIIYKDTGNAATSPLIAYIDGITVTPNGGNITIQWDSGASKIFAL